MNTALIFAGGTGTRMRTTGRPKQFLELHNKPIIIYTIECFEKHPEIDSIVVVCIESWIDYLKKQLARFGIQKVVQIVPGGSTSQESTRNGLQAVARIQDPKDTVVLIHDGVRPLITEELISDNIRMVKQKGNAITVAHAIETIVTVDGSDQVDSVIDRSKCCLARAPQCFWLSDIMELHQRAVRDDYQVIDSATLMMHYGRTLHIVEGPPENIKITTPSDFYIFRAIMDARENIQILGL